MSCVCEATVLLKSKLGIHGNQINPICIHSHIFCNHFHLNIRPGKIHLSHIPSQQLLHRSCAVNTLWLSICLYSHETCCHGHFRRSVRYLSICQSVIRNVGVSISLSAVGCSLPWVGHGACCYLPPCLLLK